MVKKLLKQSKQGLDKRQRKLRKLMNSLSEFIQPYIHSGEEVSEEIGRAIGTHKISTEVIPEIVEVEYILTKWLIDGSCQANKMLDVMGEVLYAMISFADEVASVKSLLNSAADSDLNKVDIVCRIKEAMEFRMSVMSDMCGELNGVGELLQSSFDAICNPNDADLHEKELRREYYKAISDGNEAAIQSSLEKLVDIQKKRIDSILNDDQTDLKKVHEAKLLCAELDALRSFDPKYRLMQEKLTDAMKVLNGSELSRLSQSIDAAMQDCELTDEAERVTALFDRYDKAISAGDEAEAMVVRKELENFYAG